MVNYHKFIFWLLRWLKNKQLNENTHIHNYGLNQDWEKKWDKRLQKDLNYQRKKTRN